MIYTRRQYYQKRDYQAATQIGGETLPDTYVQKLSAVFRECHRVTAHDGTLWLNLGDKYRSGRLLGMPWRGALALQGFGWVLRSDIIWHKNHAMPASVRNRPTTDPEHVFIRSKSADYFHN